MMEYTTVIISSSYTTTSIDILVSRPSYLFIIRCAVLFAEALSKRLSLPCKSADEFINTAPTVGW